MVTRIEYQSAVYTSNGGRTATVLYINPGRWHVTFRHFKRGYVTPSTVRRRWAKSLTSAQGMARTWVDR